MPNYFFKYHTKHSIMNKSNFEKCYLKQCHVILCNYLKNTILLLQIKTWIYKQ